MLGIKRASVQRLAGKQKSNCFLTLSRHLSTAAAVLYDIAIVPTTYDLLSPVPGFGRR